MQSAQARFHLRPGTIQTLLNIFIILFVFAVHLIFFLNRWITDFYFAGYVDNNLHYFHDFVSRMASGDVPYRDFPIEYPPLTVFFLWLLRPFAGSFVRFESAFIMIMLVLSILCLIVWRYSESEASNSQLLRGGLAYGLAVLAVGPIALVSTDYIPAFFTALSLVLLCRRKLFLCGISLGAAVAAKGYPVILLIPSILLIRNQCGKTRKIFSILGGFAVTVAAAVVTGVMIAPAGFLRSYSYHFERGLELGSVYSALLLPLRFAGIQFTTVFDHNSWNLTGNALTGAANKLSPILLFVLLGLVYFRMLSEIRANPRKSASEKFHLNVISSESAARFFSLTIVAFMLGFKVGSPQFLVWLLPFVPYLINARRGWLMLGLFISIGHLQQWIFPWHWNSLVYMRSVPVMILLIEKLLLIFLFVVIYSAVASRRKQILSTD